MTITKTVVINVDEEEAVKALKKLTENVDDLNEGIEETGDKSEESLKKVDKSVKKTDTSISTLTGSLDKMSGGAITGFKALSSGLLSAVRGFKTLKGAIAATGIGLLIIALVSLKAAFTGSEEGQNKFARIMAKIGVVTGNVMDVLADLGGALLSAGKALGRLAKGDLKGASDAWGEFKTGIDETTQSIKDFRKETAKEIEEAGRVADMRAKADKIDRKLLVDRARLESEIADLRLKAREEDKFTAQQREQFLKDSEVLADSLLKQEEEALMLKFEAQKLENTFSRSNKENLDKEAAAEAALFNIRTRRLTEQKAVIRELDRVRNELASNEKTRVTEEAKAAKDKLVAQEAIAKEQRKIQEEEEKETDALILGEIEREEKKADALRKIDEELAADKLKIDEELANAREEIRNAELNNVGMTFALLSQINEKSKALQAVSIIGENAVGIAKQFINTKAANAAATLKYALLPGGEALAIAARKVNNISLGIGVAASSLATGKALQALGKGGSTGGSSSSERNGGGGGAPSFNLVSGTGTNQIAEGLNQEAPIARAFVVSSDVSSAQELDRKIVEGASL